MAFYLPDHPDVQGLYLGTRRDQYFLWTHPQNLVGQKAILCLETGHTDEPLALARRYFASVSPVSIVPVTRPGFRGIVKSWEIYVCRGFRGYDPDAHASGF